MRTLLTKLTITPTVSQANKLNFSLLLTYTYPINHNSNPKHLSNTCLFPATRLVHATMIPSRWLEQPANTDLQDPSCSGLHPPLASSLNLVPSPPPLCRPVILNYLLYSMVTSCFIFFPLSKTSLLNISFPFILTFTHLSGPNLGVTSLESIPWLLPNRRLNEVPFLVLGAPKAPHTSPILALEFNCHLLVSILHKTIKAEVSGNLPIWFTTKY